MVVAFVVVAMVIVGVVEVVVVMAVVMTILMRAVLFTLQVESYINVRGLAAPTMLVGTCNHANCGGHDAAVFTVVPAVFLE